MKRGQQHFYNLWAASTRNPALLTQVKIVRKSIVLYSVFIYLFYYVFCRSLVVHITSTFEKHKNKKMVSHGALQNTY